MRKFVLLTVAAAAAFAISAGGASADARGPACADVVGGTGTFIGGNLNFTADLAAGPCSFGPAGLVTYTLEVYDNALDPEEGPSSLLDRTTSFTAVDTSIVYSLSVSDDDGAVYVVLTTRIGPHVVDRAPDTGRFEVTQFPPALGGFN